MSRLSQMLAHQQKRLGLTDRQVCEPRGWVQQTWGTWKRGTVPRAPTHKDVADFLQISPDMLNELIEEAKVSTGNTKIPKISGLDRVLQHGKVTDRKVGKYKFEPYNDGRWSVPEGRYVISIGTNVMEPGLRHGTKAWLDPAIYPKIGNEVIVHAKGGNAWIGRLEAIGTGTAQISQYAFEGNLTITDVEAIHVIVLSERI